jgi:hypothetical protein
MMSRRQFYPSPAADPTGLTAGTTTLPRHIAGINTGVNPGASGVLRLTFFRAPRSEIISQVSLVTGTTAAGATPTLCRMGVWAVIPNGDLSLVGACANDTTLFNTPSLPHARNLTAPYGSVGGQWYAFAPLVVTAAAMPTYAGVSLNAATGQATRDRRISGQLAGQTDLPALITAASILASNCLILGEILP